MRSASLSVLLSLSLVYIGCALGDDHSATNSVPATAMAASTTSATMPTSAPVAISWDQAKDFIGQDATVTGPVVGTHDFGGAAVLNVGKDYPSAKRFTVYLDADKRKAMPADLDAGKTISVTGKIKMFHHVPEIGGDPASIIVVINGASTTPASRP